jgi:ACS family hexuronate transporter-like MFS transporter
MTETGASAIGRYRWLVCFLLFLATTINYIDRQILALLKPVLDVELGWTNSQYGNVNAVFQGAYAVSLLFFGWFVDRFGSKAGYTLSIIAWSIAALGHSLVGSVRGFFMARITLGLGEGGNFPAAVKAVTLWFPKRERAYATSLFNAGTNVAAIIAPAIVPWVATAWGWRATFVGAGIIGFLWLLVWLPFYDTPERIKRLSASEMAHIRSDLDDQAASQNKVGWLDALTYPQAWSFVVAKFLTDPCWWFFLIWLPDFFKSTRGLDLKKSWLHLVTIYSIITVLSILGGWFTGYLNRRGYTVTRARKTGMLVCALAVLPVMLVTRTGDWTAVFLIGLAGAAHQAWSATIYTTVSDMFPKSAVGSIIGLGGMAGSVGGVLFPIFAGEILDKYKAQGNTTAGYAILFSICGGAYLLAFGLTHLLAPRYEQIRLRTVSPQKRVTVAVLVALVLVSLASLGIWYYLLR